MENSGAVQTAKAWLEQAVDTLDSRFGEGYARDNPVVLAAQLQAIAAAVHSDGLDDVAGRLEDVVSALNLVSRRLE